MKAFIIQVLVPDAFSKTDIVSAVNVGVQSWAREHKIELSPLEWNVTKLKELPLDKQSL